MIRFSHESAEWYTPLSFIEAVREVLGSIELDPASCSQANETVQAIRYFDRATDGLTQVWHSATLFLNPPHDKETTTAYWIDKLLVEYEAGHVREAIVLVDAATETHWFAKLSFFPLCLVRGRIRFHSGTGKPTQSPPTGSVFVYLGNRAERFLTVFAQFGRVALHYPVGTPLLSGSAVIS